MSGILGRDSLGRLIFVGDVVVDDIDHKWDVAGQTDDGHLEIRDHDWVFPAFSPERLLVYFRESPKHTNYERYFSDIGDFNTVLMSFYDACSSSCHDCPFGYWDEDFRGGKTGCMGFPKWLSEESVF